MAVLCNLYTIRCIPMHPLYGAQHVPYVPVRVTRCTLVAHRYTYAPPLCRTSQDRKRLFPSQCPSGTILLTLYSMVLNWRVSRAGPIFLHWPKLLDPLYLQLFVSFLFFRSIGWYCGAGVFRLRVCESHSPSLALPTSFNNNNNNNNNNT